MYGVISSIIGTDQTGYIKNRYMGTNIRLTSDIIEHFNLTNQYGILMMLHFKKAFDSLEWDFMYKSLESFNFGPNFIKWVKTLYRDPVACIKNNGYISPNFSISRGIRQGCPITALLFIISRNFSH